MPSTTGDGGGGGRKRPRSFGGGLSSISANQSGSGGSGGSAHELSIRAGKPPSRMSSLSLTAVRRRQRSSGNNNDNGNRPSSTSSSAAAFGGAGLRRERPNSSGANATANAPAGGSNSRGASRAPRNGSSTTSADSDDHCIDDGDNDRQARLESLTLHLSALEAQRDAKRSRLQALGEQMQAIRTRMRTLEEELQGLDGDIDDAEGRVRRWARGAGAGQQRGSGTSPTQTWQYASTQLSPSQAQDAQDPEEGDDGNDNNDDEEVHKNLDQDRHHRHRNTSAATAAALAGNGYVGSMHDVGTQDMDDEDVDEEEEEEDDNGTDGRGNTYGCRSQAARGGALATPRRCGETLAPPEEVLTDPPGFAAGGNFGGNRGGKAAVAALTMNPDEVLTEPVLPTQEDPKTHNTTGSAAGSVSHNDDEMDMIVNHYDDGEQTSKFGGGGQRHATAEPAAIGPSAGGGWASSADYAFDEPTGGHGFGAEARPGSSVSDVIELGTVYRADPPAAMVPSRVGSNFGTNQNADGGGSSNGGGGTLDSYFNRTGNDCGGRQRASADGGVLAQATSATAFDEPTPAPSVASSRFDRPTREDRNVSYMHHLARDDFPWSREMSHHLCHTFRIQSFRENQKEVINATMSGDDAMVLMRTGGGKSLTYQLPALIEGRGPRRKVSLVISPLKSLIVDQVDQMNDFVPGSAVSFMSGIGNNEHAHRWNQVRNPDGGICLIFCTPEKVSKSNRLRSELEKLNGSGRLGRFVIDEAHCCCQWGHDFRPDYTQLGILKTHFPHIPLIAVTATASQRVRDDCARILRIGTNYQLFRSTANRNNLKYSIRPKPDGAQNVIDDMIEFIKTHHPTNAGIIYCFSQKEAVDVADKLCAGGIVARPYHADISQGQKDQTQRSWQRNETQVVVATIAFGLGINKPDVRFVLHHSLSKSLEGYYQESGRAGRDGLPADCVLYYSTKDIYRTTGMIHGKQGPTGSNGFYYMLRYAQADGDDALCKKIILASLGEPGAEDLQTLLKNGCDRTESRDVGRHAKVAATLLNESSDNMTAAQLVTQWRSKNAPAYVKAHPPGTALTKDECDRLIVTLILERVMDFRVIFNAYGSTTYLRLLQKGHALLQASDPEIHIRLPKRKARASRKSSASSSIATSTKKKKVSAAKAKNTQSPAQPDDSGWIRSSEKKRKANTSTCSKSSKRSKQKKHAKGGSKTKKNAKRAMVNPVHDDVIVLSSSEDEDNEEVTRRRPSKKAKLSSKKEAKDIFDSSSSSSSSESEGWCP